VSYLSSALPRPDVKLCRTLQPGSHSCLVYDDAYYEEQIQASEELTEAEASERFALPSLISLRGDVRRLVHYALISYRYPQELTALLAEFEPWEVLQVLEERVVSTPHGLQKCLEIAAEALGQQAHRWVRHLLVQHEDRNIAFLAQAIACCLPPAEGEAVMFGALNRLTERDLIGNIHGLSYFSSNTALDWLENQRGRIHTVSYDYGETCSFLRFTWERAQRWLGLGRPLSLIALDALQNCSSTFRNYNHSHPHPPRLYEPAPVAKMDQVLNHYLEQDSVPRTKNAVRYIQQNWSTILQLES
jgi:hypothetical protein